MNNLSLLSSSSTAESEPLKLLDGNLILYKRPTVINGNVALSSLQVLGIPPVLVQTK